MTAESIAWFAGQVLAVGLMLACGTLVARARGVVWKSVAAGAAVVTFSWPLLRLAPTYFLAVAGARVVAFLEVTGVVIPAALLFTIAMRHLRQRGERRAMGLLLVVCVLYLVRNGLWMVRAPVPPFKSSTYVDGVCRQATNYTCVAASLVTLLRAYGIETSEYEMARLSYTEAGNGTTDSRAVYALERKLRGTELTPHYEALSYDRLRSVPLPCVVAIDWGYFCSHMVPVLSVTDDEVVLGDPLTGPRTVTRAEFERIWHKRGMYLSGARSRP